MNRREFLQACGLSALVYALPAPVESLTKEGVNNVKFALDLSDSIGTTRYCIFNPATSIVYAEGVTTEDEVNVKIPEGEHLQVNCVHTEDDGHQSMFMQQRWCIGDTDIKIPMSFIRDRAYVE